MIVSHRDVECKQDLLLIYHYFKGIKFSLKYTSKVTADALKVAAMQTKY